MERDDWLEAFSHHPQIGEKAHYWIGIASPVVGRRTSGRACHYEDVKTRLARGNRAYYDKFGYIYMVCATGKSAEEMLALLEQRLQNDPARELPIAAEQQRQITRLRLEKLFAGEQQPSRARSHDARPRHIARQPAVGLQVGLQGNQSGIAWKTLGTGLTDAKGAARPLLGSTPLEAGTFRLIFNARIYFQEHHMETFYPEIPWHFAVARSRRSALPRAAADQSVWIFDLPGKLTPIIYTYIYKLIYYDRFAA